MGRKRHIYDNGKQNAIKVPKMAEMQKSHNMNSGENGNQKEGKRHVSPQLQMPIIPTFVADLTPTPTRFLRSCDEVGLFNEIELKSQYSDGFKRLNSYEESVSSVQQNSESAALPSTSLAPIPSVILESVADENDTYDARNMDVSGHHGADVGENDESFAAATADASSCQLIYTAPQEIDIPAEMSLVVQQPPDPPTPADRPCVQVLLQLPGGGFLPLNIPADALAHATISTVTSQPQSAAPLPAPMAEAPIVIAPQVVAPASSYTITSSTKQKLKAAVQQNLQQHHQHLRPPQPNSVPAPYSSSSSSSCSTNSVPSSSSAALPPHQGHRDVSARSGASKTGKASSHPEYSTVVPHDLEVSRNSWSGRSSEDEESEEKRAKFLESNRAAANRCRQKKKQWINSLEEKTKQLLEVNKSLTAETTLLRREIDQLKQALAAHKDCATVAYITSTIQTDGAF